MATFNIQQIVSKQQNIQQINVILNQMMSWLQNYNQFIVGGWSVPVQGTNIIYSLTSADQANFQAQWDMLKTQILSQINSL